MSDVKPDNTTLKVAMNAPPVRHVVEVDTIEAEAAEQKRKQTAGEQIFDRTVYTGIGFGVNEVSSLWITDQFKNGKKIFGKWFCKEGFDAISEKIAKSFKIKDTTDAAGKLITGKAKAGNSLLMVTLLSGGTLLILPMKWLEDHKVYWVQKANHFVDRRRGSKMTDEQVAARDKEVEQAIACSPRQSWPTMLLGRVIACMSSVGTGTFIVGPKNNDKLMDWSEKTFAGGIKPAEQRGAWNRYARLLSVETYSCAISSVVLEIASKLFAKRSSKVHDPELCLASSPVALAAATETTSNGDETKQQSVNAQRIRADRAHVTPAMRAEMIKAQKNQPQMVV